MATAHHLRLSSRDLEGNDGLGRYVWLPGDPGRARLLADQLEQVRTVTNPRGLDVHLGRLSGEPGEPIDVAAVATGIGAGAAEVVVHELLACGARRLLRVGSCGTMNEAVRPGQVVVACAAVRDEAVTGSWAPAGFPALAHPEVTAAMCEGARRAGLAGETFRGICHSKSSLYAREFGHGPRGEENLRYCRTLRDCGVIASEMEASTLFVLAAVHAPWAGPLDRPAGRDELQAGAVLAVFATDRSDMVFDPEAARQAERRAIRVAVAGTRVWAAADRAAAAPA